MKDTVGWFGESWGAPCCEPEDHEPTPVGELCLHCEKPIDADDQGVTMLDVDAEGMVSRRAHHLDCHLAAILPHGPDCEHCRGLERILRRLLDPKTTLADVENIGLEMGIHPQRLHMIADAIWRNLKKRKTHA